MKRLQVTEQPLLNLILRDNKKENYFWQVTNGYLVYVGDKKTFKIIPEDFLDLKVGERITQIGEHTGRGQATLNRQVYFNNYVTFVGHRYEKIHINDDSLYKILLFKVPDEDRPNAESLLPTDDFFSAFIVLEDHRGSETVYELKSPYCPEDNTVQFYKPIFKRFNDL